MEEKRKFVRFGVSIPFELSSGNLSGVKGVIKDISMEGLRVSLDRIVKFMPESITSLAILLSDKPIKTSARVIWERYNQNRSEVGLRFAQILDSHKEEIINFIFKHHQKEMTQKWWQS